MNKMYSKKTTANTEPPQPGKTIVYLEGEILTVRLNQWGFIGKLRTKFGDYIYKLNDTVSASNDVLVGLKLTITNGYCYENKKKETVVSDGKFGKIATEIDLSYIKNLSSEKKRLTAILDHYEKNENTISLILKNPLPPFNKYTITSFLQKLKFDSNLSDLSNLLDKLVILEGSNDFSDFIISRFELMNENHYFVKILELGQNQSQSTTNFSQTILKQLNYIESYHASFKDVLFNMKGKVSKNLLDNLNELLLSKILDGKAKYPYNILISKKDIETYLESMIKFTRDATYGNSNIANPEQLLSYVKYYYPSFNFKNP